MADYVFSVTIDQPIDQAIETLKAALMEQHLGIVSDVNVAAIIKNKLGEEMSPYRILGACNPKMAKTMIDDTPEVGVLLPCTIAVREEGGKTQVHFMAPEPVLGMAGSAAADAVAKEATEKLQAVVQGLSS